MTGPDLRVSAAPHLRGPASTPALMRAVLTSLVPVVGVAVLFFGPSALLVVAACVAGALATERLFGPPRALRDGSAAITGLLLALSLPAGLPLWMAFVGAAFGVGLGKCLFGGLGRNVFNPALLGRAFLQAAFPVAMTTWPDPAAPWAALRGDNLAFPLASPHGDAVSGATPLGLMKFERAPTALADLLLGTTSGSLGETSALVVAAGGLWLAWRGHLDWRIPAAVLGSVAALASGLHALDPARHPGPGFMLLSGGLVLGAFYFATDPVTSPVTRRGAWIFGGGVGALVVLIRTWGGLPEGVMYSVLLMNALVPFVNRVTQPRVFGARARRGTA